MDVTERKRAETALAASERQLRTLADAIPALAWTARADGFIDWYNARWYEYTGTTPDQMAGWGWQAVHDPAVLPDVLARWETSIATGAPFEMTFPLRAADGRFRRFLTRVTPLTGAEGRVVRWFGTNTDVEAERAAREAAERASRAMSAFLATMSHELRTPLNAIAGYAELMELGIHGPVTEQQREAITRIQRSQRHLLGLINDVLNFAKLEAGHVEYAVADVAVCDVVDALEPLVAPQLSAKALRFDRAGCTERCVARADADKLQQVLLNLLSNAIKFTAAGGAITLRCEARGGAVAIAVEDTGIGIAAERLGHVFDPFVQIDRRLNAPHEGTGLGLAISRDLARGMGGDLTAESTPGVGSTFTLTLPSARRE
jgi:PAS domain S-box-containing protein